jgi:plastocyanin
MNSTRRRLHHRLNNRRRLTPFATALSSLVVAAATCSHAAVIHIDARGIAFVPATAKARVGDVVEWSNKDFVAHTATARNKAWDATLPVGKSGRVTLSKAGTVEYYCRVHPNMIGKIEVSAK